jgi:predicted TIM-barrel fold metal-dependent hydrolase
MASDCKRRGEREMSATVRSSEDKLESATRRYRLVDADTHVNEPPDLWLSRFARKYADRVPHIEHLHEGDAWVMEGVMDPINFGLNACAGIPADSINSWVRFEEIRPGGWDPAARLVEMDQDGIDAALLYPTPRISQGIVTNKDPELQVVMIEAYNNWLSEYASTNPERLLGLAVLPTCGVASAVAEYERALQLPGIRGAVMNCYPHGTDEIDPEDDRLFAAVTASGLPLNIHASLSASPPTSHKTKLQGDFRFIDAPKRMLEFLWSGVFDRYPDLKLAFIEVDCGWVPLIKEQTDNRYYRLGTANRLSINGPPSEYFDRHCFYSFITDTFGIHNRYAVGVQNMLWSSDYPHVGADWPNSRRTIEAAFSGVPRNEKEMIVARNAMDLYRLSQGDTT